MLIIVGVSLVILVEMLSLIPKLINVLFGVMIQLVMMELVMVLLAI